MMWVQSSDLETSLEGRRGRLRQATDTQHRKIDQALREGGYFANLHGYATYLRASHAARAALEAMLAPASPLPAEDYALAAVQEQDMLDLGLAPPAPTAPLPALGPGGAWGTLYVVLGASLGALHMRRWAEELGLSDIYGARHLGVQATRVPAWRGFLAALDSAALDETEEMACLAAAQAAFSRFAGQIAAHG